MLFARRGRRFVRTPTRQHYANSHFHQHGRCHPIPHRQSNSIHRNQHNYVHAHRQRNFHNHVNIHGQPYAFPAADLHLYSVANSNRYTDINLHTLADADQHADIHTNSILHSYNHSVANPAIANLHTFSKLNHKPMTDILPFLKSLLAVSGLSAYEGPAAHLIEEKWKPLVDDITASRLGSLHALKRGHGKGRRPSVMIATHMDAIGLMVTKIVDGFLHVDEIGGIDSRILPGTPVMVHGKQDLPGVIVIPPMKTLPESAREDAIGLPYLLVDVGLLPSKTASLVRVGDLVSFDTQPVELAGDILSGHSLDNRASVAALTICLEELQTKLHRWDVWAVATAQEEETIGGAATSAFDLHPDLAVAIDVTFAKSPSANDWQAFPMGKGVTLGWGANLHPFLYKNFKELADKLEIPAAMDITPAHSGTDAYSIQVAREGIPTMLLGIPLRYMHTPVELVAIKDVQRVGRLLAEFISGLEDDFVSKIVWDEE